MATYDVTAIFPIEQDAESAIRALTPLYAVVSQGEVADGYEVVWRDSDLHRAALPDQAMDPQSLDTIIRVVEANHGYLVGQASSLATLASAPAQVSRLAAPLPDSAWDRYYTAHPEERDHRTA